MVQKLGFVRLQVPVVLGPGLGSDPVLGYYYKLRVWPLTPAKLEVIYFPLFLSISN